MSKVERMQHLLNGLYNFVQKYVVYFLYSCDDIDNDIHPQPPAQPKQKIKYVYKCPAPECGKQLKSISGFRGHVLRHNLSLPIQGRLHYETKQKKLYFELVFY